MKLKLLLVVAACTMAVSCEPMRGVIYNDLDVDIYLMIYGKSDSLIGQGELPGMRNLIMLEASDMIDRIEYTVGSGRACQVDKLTFRKEIRVAQDEVWELHLKGC